MSVVRRRTNRLFFTRSLPVNKEDGVKVIICGNGKQFVLPKDIQEVQFDSESLDEETQRMIDDLRSSVELKASFDMPVPPGELFFVWSGLCTWEQLQKNNWRKLHGLIMRRRKGVSSRISRTKWRSCSRGM